MTTLRKTFKKNGNLTSPYTVKLSSSDAAYGVKRTDTDAVVVDDDTAMTEEATGVFTKTWTDPALGLTYEYSVEGFVQIDGQRIVTKFRPCGRGCRFGIKLHCLLFVFAPSLN